MKLCVEMSLVWGCGELNSRAKGAKQEHVSLGPSPGLRRLMGGGLVLTRGVNPIVAKKT